MANETIGHIKCPLGDDCTGEVRQYSKGKRKYYWVCSHGMITPNLELGQAYVEKHMMPLEKVDAVPVEAATVAEKKPAQKRKSWLSDLLGDDDE